MRGVFNQLFGRAAVPSVPRFSATQARLIDNQIMDGLANKAGAKVVSNVYTKPALAATATGLAGGLFMGPTARASLFGAKGIFPSAAKAISPQTYNVATSTMKGLVDPTYSVFGNMGAAMLPIKATMSLPGHALASGLTGLGTSVGAGTTLGSALTGAGTVISGGFLAPAIGTAATLYALKKGGQMWARSRAARGAANRIAALQKGYVPMSGGTVAKGYTPDMVRQLGLQYVR